MSHRIDKTYQKNKNAPVQSINGGHPDGEKRTLSQIGGPDGLIPAHEVVVDEGNECIGNYSSRLEKQTKKLSKRWTGTEYEMVLEKVKKMEGWKEESWMVRDNLMEWLVNNKERRLVEEAEDIPDVMEQLVEEGGMGLNEILLVEATEIITSVVLAWNLDVERITFVNAGKEDEAFQKDGE